MPVICKAFLISGLICIGICFAGLLTVGNVPVQSFLKLLVSIALAVFLGLAIAILSKL